jgi:hypothetical protein
VSDGLKVLPSGQLTDTTRSQEPSSLSELLKFSAEAGSSLAGAAIIGGSGYLATVSETIEAPTEFELAEMAAQATVEEVVESWIDTGLIETVESLAEAVLEVIAIL